MRTRRTPLHLSLGAVVATAVISAAILGFGLTASATLPASRSLVIPHVVETAGTVGNTQNAFDTLVHAVYTPGLAGIAGGSKASLRLYLYSNSGDPMVGSGGTAVCNPCTRSLGTSIRKVDMRIDDLIVGNGGGFEKHTKLGFAVIVIGGSDPDGVAVDAQIVHSHTGPFDLSIANIGPIPVPATPHDLAIPHVVEKQGTISTTQFTFDTSLFVTYTAGLAGTPSGGGASFDLYLFAKSGEPMRTFGGDICSPCGYTLSESKRKVTIRLDDLIEAHGGFDTKVKSGFAIIVLGGADPGSLGIQGFVVNSHTSAFDLSVFGFQPQPLLRS
jgi:hypothetical protein